MGPEKVPFKGEEFRKIVNCNGEKVLIARINGQRWMALTDEHVERLASIISTDTHRNKTREEKCERKLLDAVQSIRALLAKEQLQWDEAQISKDFSSFLE